MQKVMLSLILGFLLFGMLLHAPLVIANDNDTNSTDDNDSDDDSDDGDVEDDEDEDEEEDEDEDDDSEERRLELERKRLAGLRDAEMRRKEILREGDCTIKIEKTVKFEDGNRIEIVKKERICPDGQREEVKVRLENDEERKKMRYEFRGKEHDVETEEGIELEEDLTGDEYKLKARLRNGEVRDIKVMPDVASEIAIERLRALGFTVELREVGRKTDGNETGNVTKIAYHATAHKNGRFIGVFKMKVKVETQIDAETGEVITVTKPWWAAFVSGEDSDQTGEDTESDDDEEDSEDDDTDSDDDNETEDDEDNETNSSE